MRMVEMSLEAWEKIYKLAIGAVDWDDTDGTVDEATARERARECCEEVIMENERMMRRGGDNGTNVQISLIRLFDAVMSPP